MTRCKNQPAKLKDIIGSFTPFLIAVLAQYVLNFIDVAILFFMNMRSDEKSNSENTIGKILQMDYNQPMNQAYLVLEQDIVFMICLGGGGGGGGSCCYRGGGGCGEGGEGGGE